MFKNTLFAILASASLVSFADVTSSSPVSQPVTQAGDNQKGTMTPDKTADSKQANSPTVNSRAASSQLFPEQDALTGTKGQKYNTTKKKKPTTPKGKSFDNNKTDNSNYDNSPTVSSFAYSGSQFPEQNKVTGTKGAKYKSSSAKKQPSSYEVNKPTVNSFAYSGAQFPQQNAITGTKHVNASAAQ